MIKISTVQLWVHDQDEALAFYTQKLGLEVRADVTVPEMGDFAGSRSGLQVSRTLRSC
jgi:catechol 2,3-dioxygenase-like lactoylglutathione lyase family enzyme